LLSGSMIVSGGRIDASKGSVTGSLTGTLEGTSSFADGAQLAQEATSSISASFGIITGSFRGTDTGSISFFGSGTHAEDAKSAHDAISASFASGGTVVATVGPFSVELNSVLGSFANLTSITAPASELGGGLSRMKVTLDNYNEFRITAALDTQNAQGAQPKIIGEFSMDEVTWDIFSSGAFAYLTQSSITADSGYSPLVSESLADVFLRVSTLDGPVTGAGATAKVGLIALYFR